MYIRTKQRTYEHSLTDRTCNTRKVRVSSVCPFLTILAGAWAIKASLDGSKLLIKLRNIKTFSPQVKYASTSLSHHKHPGSAIIGLLRQMMERLSAIEPSSPLLLLPIELRQNIYAHLFLAPQRDLHYCDVCGHVCFNPQIPLQILRVCSQLSMESKDWLRQSADQLALQHKHCQVYVHRCWKCASRFPWDNGSQNNLVPLKYGRMIWQVSCLSSRWLRYLDLEDKVSRGTPASEVG